MLTCYCKKCNRDVPVGDHCPQCGGKLSPSQAHAAWALDHNPAADWMCWNAVLRVALPVAFAVVLLVIAAEGLMGGAPAVERLLLGSFLPTILWLLLALCAVLLLVLLLQGEDILDCVVDSRGVHVQTYLPEPTRLKLLLRLRSPELLQRLDPRDPAPSLPVNSREIGWKDVRRVQLWPEKNMMLFYGPRWWLRVWLPCDPYTWQDCADFVTEKLGKKKQVILPAMLRQAQPGARGKARKSGGAAAQLDLMSDIRAMNAEAERADRAEEQRGAR